MQLVGTPLVWFGQVQVLEEEHHSLAVFWSEDMVQIGGDGEAHLSQLLQDVGRSSLCPALHSGYLAGREWCKTVEGRAAWKRGERIYICCAKPSLNTLFGYIWMVLSPESSYPHT